MVTFWGKSCSIGLLCVFVVKVYQFVCAFSGIEVEMLDFIVLLLITANLIYFLVLSS